MNWNWWDKLKPQMIEFLRELAARGIYADDVREILSESNWIESTYIKKERFTFEKTEFTLRGLCDSFLLLTGGYDFEEALKCNIKSLLDMPDIQRTEEVA